MIQILNIKGTEVPLSFKESISPNGRPFRLSGIKKNSDAKFINRVEKWQWIYTFIYTDDGSFFGFEIGYNDEFIRKLTHKEVIEL